jgi:hypothetical protein
MLYRTLDLTDAKRRQAFMEAAEASSTPSVRKRLRHTEELKLSLLIPHEMLGVWLDCPAYTRLGTLFWRSSRGMVSSISLHIDYAAKEIGDGQTYSDEAREESEWLTPPALEGTYARLAYLVKACSQGEEGFTLKLTGRLPDEGWPRIFNALCGDGEDGIYLAKYTIDLPSANQFFSEDFELLPRLRYLRDLPVWAHSASSRTTSRRSAKTCTSEISSRRPSLRVFKTSKTAFTTSTFSRLTSVQASHVT